MAKRSSPLDRFARELPPGELRWIGVRSQRRGQVVALKQVAAIASQGLEGDHRMEKTPGSARQVTIISEEFIAQIAYYLSRDAIEPSLLRRNLVLKGVNLNALRYQQFQIGGAIFEASALCHPCSRMEQALGKGGVAAMLGHGGLCARILQSGELRLGDQVLVRSDDISSANSDAISH
ncbi:MAG: MOSC domain-containing protein [Pseudomonadota bacterium]